MPSFLQRGLPIPFQRPEKGLRTRLVLLAYRVVMTMSLTPFIGAGLWHARYRRRVSQLTFHSLMQVKKPIDFKCWRAV